jgi:hypothetical protein
MLSSQTTHFKKDLTTAEYINMVALYESSDKAEDEKYDSKYEEYSIIDAIIALEFFCNFMYEYYNEVTEKRVTTIPLTASGSSELAFLK